jgi:beta propeller repeat protein
LILLLFLTSSVVSAFGNASSVASTSTLLTVLSGQTHQQFPVIYGDRVIWVDSSGTGLVHLYNISTGEETALISDYIPADGEIPAIFDHFVSWTHNTGLGYGVLLYDIDTGEEWCVVSGNGTMAWNPDLGRGSVVWEEHRLGSWDIYSRDIATGEETILTPDTDDTDQTNPAISNSWIAWQSYYSDTDTHDIFLYSRVNGNTTPITPGTEDTDELYPAIDGEYLVYERIDPYTWCSDIYLFNITSEETLLLTPGTEYTSERTPDIHDGRVVWTGQDPSDYSYELFLYEIDSGSTTLLQREIDQTDPSLPAIFGERVVWQQPDPETGYFDIYMVTLGIDDPPLVADFTADPLKGGVPLQVNFTDLSSGGPSGWLWNFGDGSTSREQNPVHTYPAAGVYDISLLIHTAHQRSGMHIPGYIYVGSPPAPAFSFDRCEGLAPLTVRFSDQSTGTPGTYLWDFGDGTTSVEKDPEHTYVLPGSYGVSLTTGNEFGNATASVDGCIMVPQGVRNDMVPDIPGISCEYESSLQRLTLNSSLVQVNVLNDTSVEVVPSSDTGIGKILFTSGEGFSWTDQFSLTCFVTGVQISSPPLFYGEVEDNSSVTYRVTGTEYPQNGTFHAELWENATPWDYQKFNEISILGNYSGICGVAFTAQFGHCNFSGCPAGTLVFGLDPEWIEQNGWRRTYTVDAIPDKAGVYLDSEFIGYSPVVLDERVKGGDHTLRIEYPGCTPNETTITLPYKRDSIRVIRVADDGSGEVLPATFLYHDTQHNIDYFSAESPNGFSTFGVASTSRAGSPIQVFYLTLSKFVSGQESGGTTTGGGGGGGYGGSGSVSSAAPAPTAVPTQSGPLEEVAAMAPARVSGAFSEEAATITATTTMTPGEMPLPGNPAAGLPSAIGFVLIRNVAIVFGVVLVAALLVLRWRRGGNES